MSDYWVTAGALCLALSLTGCANTAMSKAEDAAPKSASAAMASPLQMDYETALASARPR